MPAPLPALLLVLAAQAAPPETAMDVATAGLVLAPVGGAALGALVATGALDGDGPDSGAARLGTVAGYGALALGAPLVAGGTLQAQSVLASRGRHVSSAPGWIAVTLAVGAAAVPELMRTPDGTTSEPTPASTRAWTGAVLYTGAYAAAVTEYVLVRRAWVRTRPSEQVSREQGLLRNREDRELDEQREDDPSSEPPEPPNPEPPMPLSGSWALAPASVDGGAGLVLVATF